MRRAALLLCLAVLPVLFVVAQPLPAAAQAPAKARLTYAVGPGVSQCPGEDRLRQEVSLRMGGDPFDPAAQGSVSVTVDRRGDSLVGRVIHVGPAGQRSYDREFSVQDTPCGCWSLVTTLAVAITFALTPFRVQEEPGGPPPPCPEPRPCPLVEPEARPCPPAPAAGPLAAAPPADVPEIQVGAGGLLGLGMGKSAAGGGFALLRLRWPIVSLGIEAHAHAPSGAEGERGTPLLASAYLGALVACAHHGMIHGCAVGELGLLRLQAAAGAPADGLHPLLTAGMRAGLELPLGDRFLLQLRAELLGTAAPSRLRIGVQEDWQSSILSGTLGAAALARF